MLFSDGWLPKESYYGIRYILELDQEMPGAYMARSREGDSDHQSWKRTLHHLSHDVKPLLKKSIIKDTLGGEGQCNTGDKVFINRPLVLSVFICSPPCSTTLRVLLGRGATVAAMQLE